MPVMPRESVSMIGHLLKGPIGLIKNTDHWDNSVVLVCSLWGIMLFVPIFWTRTIIILDYEIFPPPNLDLQLCASGERSIDIVVTQASQLDAIGLKDIEQSRMIHIINVLRPHFRQWSTKNRTVRQACSNGRA